MSDAGLAKIGVLVCVSLLAPALAFALPDSNGIELSDCLLEDASGTVAVTARCGSLSVPEYPATPDGAGISLRVAVVPALNGASGGDAFTVLAGGPGGAATEFYAAYARAFAYIHRDLDILLVDQRGTGDSAPLDCPVSPEPEYDADPAAVKALGKDCLSALGRDVAPFTTSIAVQDLDAVRAALGYRGLHLYGGSYGTRVALHYLRRFPDHSRSLILDGVVPPGLALGPDIAVNAQQALERLFARCAAGSDCSARFPRLAVRFDSLKRRLEREPEDLSLLHPRTAAVTELEFGAPALGTAVRLLSYNDHGASLLPLLISSAADGHFQPLAAQTLMVIERLGETLSAGMHNTVVCSEDLPFVTMSPERWRAMDDSYLGRAPFESLEAVCSIWPTGPVDTDFHEPLDSAMPVLLLSGSEDPATPPAYAEQARKGLSRSRHLVVEGHGHGVAALGCMPRLLAEFVRDGDPEALDASCVERIAPAPLFLDFGGPGP